jgi:hypothetical protein
MLADVSVVGWLTDSRQVLSFVQKTCKLAYRFSSGYEHLGGIAQLDKIALRFPDLSCVFCQSALSATQGPQHSLGKSWRAARC